MTKKILLLIISLILIFFSVSSLFHAGFFQVHDNTQVERVFEMKKALMDGQFPVRIVEDLGYGYGYPIFNFYAPLPYYIGGFFNLIFNNSLVSTKLMMGIGVVLSFFSMYILGRSFYGKISALVAASVYLYFPYHAVNIYVRGAVGEYYAYAFLPLVFWGVYELYRKINSQKKGRIPLGICLITSFAIAGVVLSHNLTAFMLFLILSIFALVFLLLSQKKKIFIYSLVVTCLLSFLLSSFYILPATLESSYTDVASQLGGGAYYADNFVCLNQLWSSLWGFGGSIPGCLDGMSFALGKINILLTIFALLIFIFTYIKTRKIESKIVVVFLFLFLSIFLVLPYSKFIWDIVPFMEFLQYPWRFLNFVGLFLSISIAYIVYYLRPKGAAQLIGGIVIIVLTIAFNTRFFALQEIIQNPNSYYENKEHIRFDVSKISDEYMPKYFDTPNSVFEIPRYAVESNNPDMKIESITEKSNRIEFVKKGSGGKVKINKAYFPSWKAFADEEEINIRQLSDGMQIELEKGEKHVVILFSQTTVQLMGNILTIIGIASIFAVIIIKNKKGYE